MSDSRTLADVKALKACSAGERVTFRARALRFWETGGLRMCLVGDRSGLTRVEVGDIEIEQGRSYEFREALVREYAGGWHSASVAGQGDVVPLDEEVPVSQDEAYIERTFKILSGVQRKKARREGRLPAWKHPAKAEGEGRDRE